MIRVRNTLAVLAFTALFGCAAEAPASTPTTEQVNLSLYSTYATQPLTRDLTEHYVDIRPEFQMDVTTNSYSQLMSNLSNKTIDYFISSYIPSDDNIWAAPIGRDGLILIVNPDNPMSDVSTDTIREIFNGQNTSWQSLNGLDESIIPLTYQSNDDIYHEFHRLIMGRQRITSNAQVVPNIEAMIRQVALTPQAIGYIPYSHITSTVNLVSVDGITPDATTIDDNIYPLRSTIFVIGREEPPPTYRTFLSWVQSSDGQQVVAEHNIPLP